jgi:hypothetical protein
MIKRLGILFNAAVLAGCASAPVQWADGNAYARAVHHPSKHSRTKPASRAAHREYAKAWTQPQVAVYDVGRTVDANGVVHEAHRTYRVVEDARPLLSLPKTPTGPPTPFTPPYALPPTNDQRVTDAVRDIQSAKERLIQKVQDRLEEDNGLRKALEDKTKELEAKNRELQDKVDKRTTSSTEDTGEANPNAQAKAEPAAKKALADWSKKMEGK